MTAIVKIKIMPSAVDADLAEIKEKTKKLIEEKEGRGVKFEEELIAFGLKAVIVFFLWDEEKELEPLEKELEKIEDISSIQTIDIRRAIG